MKAVVRPQVGQQRLLGGLGRFGAAAVNDITGVVCVGTDLFVFILLLRTPLAQTTYNRAQKVG